MVFGLKGNGNLRQNLSFYFIFFFSPFDNWHRQPGDDGSEDEP